MKRKIKMHKLNKNKPKAIHLIKKLARNKSHKAQKAKSVGTQRGYRDCITIYLNWCISNAISPNVQSNLSTLKSYILDKSKVYRQKTLDQHRMALNAAFSKKLTFTKALVETVLTSRDYLLSDVLLLVENIEPKNSLGILLCFYTGARAHELATLQRIDEGARTSSRIWSSQLFVLEEDFTRYLVTGKGGLCREIAIPNTLVKILESLRLPNPVEVCDREILYQMNYDLGFGQAISQCFSRASLKHFENSTGLHGLRHSYVKNRVKKLCRNGYSLEDAKLIVSQEIGHFRHEIIDLYLR